jgi:hypothetical protein
MPKTVASTFTLHSIDHDQALLSDTIHSTRHLLENDAITPKALKLTFTADGTTHESVLHRNKGVFGEGATLRFLTEEGERVEEAPETFIYYSEDKNWVLTFHENGKFDGLLFSEDGKHITHFVGENGQLKLNGDINSYFPSIKPGRKLTSEVNGIDYWDGCHDAQPKGLSTLDIGVVFGNVFLKRFGQSGAVRELNSYIGLTNQIYGRQMDILISVMDSVFVTDPSMTTFTPSSCSMSINSQLSRLANWNPPSRQVLWHLLDDCFGFSGGTLGIAYLGTLCSSYNVGVSYYSDHLYDDDEYPTWATVAHELGHNFDAQHSFEEGQGRTGGIMDYGFLRNKLINGEVQFNSKYREREVCREVQSAYSRNCLNVGIAPSPSTQLTESVPVNREVFAEAERRINCAKHTHRMPSSATNLKRMNGLDRIACQKECALRENCNGFVYNREDGWCELLDEQIVPETLTFTSEFNTYICFERDIESRFVGRSEDDVLDTMEADVLKEACCSTTFNEAFQGLNLNFRENLTQKECEAECVKNSKCDAVTFRESDQSCLIFGGNDFSNIMGEMQGVSTLRCDRACISSVVVQEGPSPIGSESNDTSGLVVFGVMFVLVGLIAAFFGYSRGKTANEAVAKSTVVDESREVYQATL